MTCFCLTMRQLALLVSFKLSGRHATLYATLSIIGCTAGQIKKVADFENVSHPVPGCFKRATLVPRYVVMHSPARRTYNTRTAACGTMITSLQNGSYTRLRKVTRHRKTGTVRH